jgi:group I intron endonuclease
VYVGSAVNIRKRWLRHKLELKKQRHFNCHLQNAWNKYGEKNFVFEVLELVDDEVSLLLEEGKWIEKNSKVQKYNIALETSSPMKGRKHSEKTKKKISKALRGKMVGEKNPMYGKSLSKETRQKMSDALRGDKHPFYGKHHTDKSRKKISQSLSAENHPMYGKKFSDQHNSNLSKAVRGERNPNAKLTWEKVRKIREDYKNSDCTQRSLAIEYNVDQKCIANIVNNKTWKGTE